MVAVQESRPAAVIELDRLGFKYREDAQFDLEQLSVERRIQVREPAHYAPRENVERYAIQMDSGARFPAIIVTEDNWVIDGNTRIGACLRAKHLRFPAIILDVHYETASPARRQELELLAAGLNNQNGQSLTRAEARRNIASALARNLKIEHISRLLGVNAATIAAVKREIAGAEKLARVGLLANSNGDAPTKAQFGKVPLRALGHKTAQELNDEPFKELALFARDAAFGMDEFISTAKDIRELGSDRAQLEKLTELRVENEERIRQVDLTGQGQPPVCAQLRQRLGFINNDDNTPTLMVDRNRDNAEMHTEALRRAIKKLQAALTEQERLA